MSRLAPTIRPGRPRAIAVGQRYQVGEPSDPSVYEVESVSGPDRCYPIVLRRVSASSETMRCWRQTAERNLIRDVDGYVARAMAHRMRQDEQWFRLRRDVVLLPEVTK